MQSKKPSRVSDSRIRVARRGETFSRWAHASDGVRRPGSVRNSCRIRRGGCRSIACLGERDGHETSLGAPPRMHSTARLAPDGTRVALDPIVRAYNVARDGRFLMIKDAGAEPTSALPALTVIVNWTEELKARLPAKSTRPCRSRNRSVDDIEGLS